MPPSSMLFAMRPSRSCRAFSTTTQTLKPRPNARPVNIPPRAKRVMVERPPTPLPTITPEAFAASPWTIRRTPFAQLPVYREWRAGKTKEVIMIKKVSGNKKLLMEQLKEKANIPSDKIVLSPVTGHIEVTGHFFVPIQDYILAQGF